jgi:hypothetical protein
MRILLALTSQWISGEVRRERWRVQEVVVDRLAPIVNPNGLVVAEDDVALDDVAAVRIPGVGMDAVVNEDVIADSPAVAFAEFDAAIEQRLFSTM